MSELIPAIIPKDYPDLEDKLGLLVGHVPMAHIDVLDGTFTPKASWPYDGDIREFLRITEEVEGFPFWEDLSFEAHLMVKDPEAIVEDWIKAGAERIIIHLESFTDDNELSRFLAQLKNRFTPEHSYLGIEVGLAIKMETPIDKLLPHVLEADFIQLMSIDTIGSQGAKFDEKTFERIKTLKEKYPETIISVDGGVNIDNAELLIQAGVSRLVAGSAIFGEGDNQDAMFDLLDITQR